MSKTLIIQYNQMSRYKPLSINGVSTVQRNTPRVNVSMGNNSTSPICDFYRDSESDNSLPINYHFLHNNTIDATTTSKQLDNILYEMSGNIYVQLGLKNYEKIIQDYNRHKNRILSEAVCDKNSSFFQKSSTLLKDFDTKTNSYEQLVHLMRTLSLVDRYEKPYLEYLRLSIVSFTNDPKLEDNYKQARKNLLECQELDKLPELIATFDKARRNLYLLESKEAERKVGTSLSNEQYLYNMLTNYFTLLLSNTGISPQDQQRLYKFSNELQTAEDATLLKASTMDLEFKKAKEVYDSIGGGFLVLSAIVIEFLKSNLQKLNSQQKTLLLRKTQPKMVAF